MELVFKLCSILHPLYIIAFGVIGCIYQSLTIHQKYKSDLKKDDVNLTEIKKEFKIRMIIVNVIILILTTILAIFSTIGLNIQ